MGDLSSASSSVEKVSSPAAPIKKDLSSASSSAEKVSSPAAPIKKDLSSASSSVEKVSSPAAPIKTKSDSGSDKANEKSSPKVWKCLTHPVTLVCAAIAVITGGYFFTQNYFEETSRQNKNKSFLWALGLGIVGLCGGIWEYFATESTIFNTGISRAVSLVTGTKSSNHNWVWIIIIIGLIIALVLAV